MEKDKAGARFLPNISPANPLCGRAEIGRRARFGIWWIARSVGVRFPSPAPRCCNSSFVHVQALVKFVVSIFSAPSAQSPPHSTTKEQFCT
jgi:hypothetical protein